MVSMTIIELVGYREWTESIGEDREWRLQALQARLYASVQEAAARYNAFVLPFRYDYMVVATTGVPREGLVEVFETASSRAPVPVRMAEGCGGSPVEAIEDAWARLRSVGPGELSLRGCNSSRVVAGHLDINDITRMTRELGLLKTYDTMLHVVSEIQVRAECRGAVAQYLGGDNILVLLPPEGYLSVVEELIAVHDLKAGIGVASNPRRALELAARALHDIRTGAAAGRIREYVEGDA